MAKGQDSLKMSNICQDIDWNSEQMNSLDALDRQLVQLLREDGRASMQTLSAATGLSRSAVFTRVRRLESDGVVTGYAAQVNRRALGMQIRAFCNVQLKQHDAQFLKEFEARIEEDFS